MQLITCGKLTRRGKHIKEWIVYMNTFEKSVYGFCSKMLWRHLEGALIYTFNGSYFLQLRNIRKQYLGLLLDCAVGVNLCARFFLPFDRPPGKTNLGEHLLEQDYKQIQAIKEHYCFFPPSALAKGFTLSVHIILSLLVDHNGMILLIGAETIK